MQQQTKGIPVLRRPSLLGWATKFHQNTMESACPPIPRPFALVVAESPTRPKPICPSSVPSTVRLLVPCTGTRAAKLLGLAAAVVGNKKCPVELDEGLLQRVLGRFVDVL